MLLGCVTVLLVVLNGFKLRPLSHISGKEEAQNKEGVRAQPSSDSDSGSGGEEEVGGNGAAAAADNQAPEEADKKSETQEIKSMHGWKAEEFIFNGS